MSEIKIPAAQHEHIDIGSRFIWTAFAVLLISVAALVLIVLWLFPLSTTDRTLRLPLPSYPAPRLQQSPREDLAQFRAERLRALNSYGWVDQSKGVVHIPIDEAMRRVAQEGIAGWPAGQESKP